MPSSGWVIDLGANRGLFSVWAARNGAEVVAVEAQQGFADEIRGLAALNGVADRVHIEVAMASGVDHIGGRRWRPSRRSPMGDDPRTVRPTRPADVSVPQLMSSYQIDRIGLLKMDIEGGEFAVLGAAEDLGWLNAVDQIVLEVHRDFGDVSALIGRLRRHGFTVDLRDNDGGRITTTLRASRLCLLPPPLRLSPPVCRACPAGSHSEISERDNLMQPKLGVLAHSPIQYHSPLYDRLAERGNVELDVLYLSDKGYRATIDPKFGVAVAWDIDLLSGHTHQFLDNDGWSTDKPHPEGCGTDALDSRARCRGGKRLHQPLDGVSDDDLPRPRHPLPAARLGASEWNVNGGSASPSPTRHRGDRLRQCRRNLHGPSK